jgi:hypothetical protein
MYVAAPVAYPPGYFCFSLKTKLLPLGASSFVFKRILAFYSELWRHSRNGSDKYIAGLKLLPIISEKRSPIVDGERAHAYMRVCPPKGVGRKQFHFKLSTRAAPRVIEKMIIVLGRVEINGGEQAGERVHTGDIMEQAAHNDAPMTKGERNLSIKPRALHKSNYVPATCLSHREIKIIAQTVDFVVKI